MKTPSSAVEETGSVGSRYWSSSSLVSGYGKAVINRSRNRWVGTLTLSSSARFSRYDSAATKKNPLSFISGPPSEPPPWFHFESGFSFRKNGLDTSAAPS